MLVDGTVGGTTEGGDIRAIVDQLANADRMGYAGVWSTEVATGSVPAGCCWRRSTRRA